jgi:hypothetical protein
MAVPLDPNWLYSTIAQSSAAIVAIIGGFITASVLTLTAEKRHLIVQKNEKQAQLSTRNEEEKRLIEQYETVRVELFLSSVMADLWKLDELPPLEQLIKQYGQSDLDPAVLEREYSLLTKQRIRARQFIEDNMKTCLLTKYTSLQDWVNGNKLDISSLDVNLLSDEYSRYRKREDERLKLEETMRYAKLPEFYRKFMPPPSLLSIIGRQDLPVNRIDVAEQDKESQLNDRQSRLELLRYEMGLLGNEIKNLDGQIDNFSYPPNLGWGITVLAFLAIAGILFPVAVIAFEWHSASVLIALISFFLGIIGVFAYIIALIRTLKK